MQQIVPSAEEEVSDKEDNDDEEVDEKKDKVEDKAS